MFCIAANCFARGAPKLTMANPQGVEVQEFAHQKYTEPEPTPSPVDDYIPTFYIGHHESKRPLPVTDFVLRQAQDVGVLPLVP